MVRFFLAFYFCLLCTNVVALNCEGTFEQKIVIENKQWSWMYSNEGYSLSGETLLHKEHDSFTVIASEGEECMVSGQCSISSLACAVSFALIEPFGRRVSLGRLQTTSYGLYFGVRDMVQEVKDCNRAYGEYYVKIREYWKSNLSGFGHGYRVKKVHPREIKLNKPKVLGDQCFDRSANLPALWSGIDYFPVLTVELQ